MAYEVDWEAVTGIGTAAQAAAVLVSLPVIIGQLVQTRRVHVEQMVERGNSNAIETRGRLQSLIAHVATKKPWTSAEMIALRDIVLRLEYQTLALEAETRLRGILKTHQNFMSFSEDIASVNRIASYGLDAVEGRIQQLQKDTVAFEEYTLKRFEASEEDAEAVRRARSEKNYERARELMSAIASKHRAKKGVSAEEMIRPRKSGASPEPWLSDDSHFAAAGGDVENNRLLDFWFTELQTIVRRNGELIDKVFEIRGAGEMKKVVPNAHS